MYKQGHNLTITRQTTMGKSKAKKKSHGDIGPNTNRSNTKKKQRHANQLLTAQQTFLNTLPLKTRTHFFSSTQVTPEQRAEIWEAQADLGENLVNKYAWATPDARLLKVFQHFGPIIEVGCGANAYWSKWMHTEGDVEVIALDVSLESGGKIPDGAAKKKSSKKKKQKNKNNAKDDEEEEGEGGLVIRQGSPESLSEDDDVRDSGRTLFLCYPDEEVYQPEEDQDDDDEEMDAPPMSMAAACLEHFTGNTIIHVGELYGDTLSLDQAPFGRSSSNEFQQRLAGEYHCILKMKLENNWLHVRDTLSVWKRSETCCIAFANDDEESDDDEEDGDADEAYYKHIPPEELLPVDLAAPCVAHLLVKSDGSNASHKDTSPSSQKDAELSGKQPGSIDNQKDTNIGKQKTKEMGSDEKVVVDLNDNSGGKKKKRKKTKGGEQQGGADTKKKHKPSEAEIEEADDDWDDEVVAGSAW